MKYRLTEAAVDDIHQVLRHIRVEQQSPQNARLVATRLRAASRKIARYPMLGHLREDLRDDRARVLPGSGLLVIYDPTDPPPIVLRVLHAARDLGRVQARV